MKTFASTCLAALTLAAGALAQAPAPSAPPGAPNSGNDPNRSRTSGGGDRPRSYEDFRKMMADRLKTALKVNDDEWGVIQPLVEKVTMKQRDAGGSRFGGGPPRSSSSNDPGRPPERAGTAEREALRAAIEDENSSPETLKARLAAVREIRQKAAAELAEAREDLKKVLTVRQEAVLVSFGILE